MSTLGLFKPFCKNGHPRSENSVSKNKTCKVCKRLDYKINKRWLNRKKKPKTEQQRIKDNLRAYNYRHSEKGKVQQKVTRKIQNLKQYGLSLNAYNELLFSQSYQCAICNKHQNEFSKALAVDHNHTTGKVRGLLCATCNTKIVSVIENFPHLIEKTIQYLNRGK